MAATIQGLWVGDELSRLEQLSIASFLAHGHQYHLYTYNNVANVPAGTIIKNANDIIAADRIFTYRHHLSYAGFSNFFRYRLLMENGGWWADLDMVCLQPLEWLEDYVFATELLHQQTIISSCLIKVPAGCPLMTEAWSICQSKQPDKLQWGETGPRLMTQLVQTHQLSQHARPVSDFCFLGPFEWDRVLDPCETWHWPRDTQTLHLWNEKWRRAGQDKNAQYDPNCLYERLKQSYLSSATRVAQSAEEFFS